MKTPRDVSGASLVKALQRIGYSPTRQRGDHVYLTTAQQGEHHVAVPLHNPVKVGTLSAILGSVATHLGIDRAELIRVLNL